MEAVDYHQYAGDFQKTINRHVSYNGRILFWIITDQFLEPDVWEFEPDEVAECLDGGIESSECLCSILFAGAANETPNEQRNLSLDFAFCVWQTMMMFVDGSRRQPWGYESRGIRKRN